MIRCRQCDALMEDARPFCPECGHEQGPQRPPMSAAASIFQVILGFLTGFCSPSVFGIGYFVAIAMYFVLRRDYPVFAKGMLVGILTFAAIILGLLATCVVLIFATQQQGMR